LGYWWRRRGKRAPGALSGGRGGLYSLGFFDIGHYNCLSLEKSHYISPIRRSTIIISSLTHPCHFLRLSRIRAHFQIVYLHRWIRTSNSQTTPLNGAGARAPPRHCCRPWRRRHRVLRLLLRTAPLPLLPHLVSLARWLRAHSHAPLPLPLHALLLVRLASHGGGGG